MGGVAKPFSKLSDTERKVLMINVWKRNNNMKERIASLSAQDQKALSDWRFPHTTVSNHPGIGEGVLGYDPLRPYGEHVLGMGKKLGVLGYDKNREEPQE